MGKRNINKSKKIVLDENLPQNILPIGDRVEYDKNIYISQQAYNDIHSFTKNKLTNESGGMLIGNVIEEFGKTNIIIHGFIEAKYTEATPTTLKFTHETWEYVHKEIDSRFENGKIVGWIHTHPDFGIFLSEYDKFIQDNFFKEDYQVAYVVDPIQHDEGFYFWINEKIERCKGFYIFAKTGEKIEIEKEQEKKEKNMPEASRKEGNIYKYKTLVFALSITLIVVMLLAVMVCVNTINRISILEKQQERLTENVQNDITYLQQEIIDLKNELASLNNESNDENDENEAEQEDGTDVEADSESEIDDDENANDAIDSESTPESNEEIDGSKEVDAE